MTLTAAGAFIQWPGTCRYFAGAPLIATDGTVNAAGDYMAYVFSAREDMTITHVGFRAAGAASTPKVIVSVETVSLTTGFPNGDGFGSVASAATAVSANTYQSIQLGTAATTVTRGSIVAVKVLMDTGSIPISRVSNISASIYNLPYTVDNQTGTPSIVRPAGIISICPQSAAGVTYPVENTFPLHAIHATSGVFDNTSSAQRGMRFTLPFDARAVGIQWYNGTAVADYTIQLMDDSENILSSSDTAVDGTLSAANATGMHRVFFDHSVSLTRGTYYKATVVPAAASSAVYALQAVANTYAAGFPGLGNSLYTYYDGSWHDTDDTLPLMDIIIDQVDVTAASSGGGGIIGG